MLEKNFRKEFSILKNLKKIKGISNASANFICLKLGVSPQILYKDISKRKLNLLSSILTNLKRESHLGMKEGNEYFLKKIIIDRNLSLTFKEKINEQIKLNTHRGRRIKYGFPAHGQRTSSNAKTAKKTKKLFK
tara:strand:- start:908 stop:1309 length:402 start_codon:yes stop_codon:yes gene_type:complete